MPPTGTTPSPQPTVEAVVASLGSYSVEAYYFIQQGIHLATERVHGPYSEEKSRPGTRHVSGRQLCETLRDLAIERWGYMASVVLRSWGLKATSDFGRLVFAFVDAGHWQKTPNDSIHDFESVYSFRDAFDQRYQIKISEKAVKRD
jgi:uncharacterized repeat protein (TIGR04138 family)